MRLVLSGGGTGGHIIPNIALIQELREKYHQQDLQLIYFGTKKGMERKLIEALQVPYKAIACGKLRRYFSWQNFIDIFKIPVGVFQAFFELRRFRPQAIFCKGGYVCFPVAIAGKILKIPVILHESDVTPGLSNKLSARFASIICISYPESKKFFPSNKVVLTGNPVRRELAFGNKEDGLKFTDFQGNKPVILFMGGSSGAEFINKIVFENFEYLLSHYQIVHICGEGKAKSSQELWEILNFPNQNPSYPLENQRRLQKLLSNYRAFPFVKSELKDLYALADVIISRAGAVSLAEIDFFNKPTLLIPPSKASSRGDQIENAQVYAKNHPCRVLMQEDFTSEKLKEELEFLLKLKPKKAQHHNKFEALEKIVQLLERV